MTNIVEALAMSPLELLDKLDAFRRKHHNDTVHLSDWCMRSMEAIVAEEFGFGDRSSWTEALKADKNSRYYRDLQDSIKTGF